MDNGWQVQLCLPGGGRREGEVEQQTGGCGELPGMADNI